MIANTVIVFLRDLLPIFILYSYLATLYSDVVIGKNKNGDAPFKINLSNWVQSVSVGVVFTILLFLGSELISDWFDGRGLEISHVILIFIAYSSFVSLPLINRNTMHKLNVIVVLCIGAGVFTSLKGTEFIFYFWVHIQRDGQFLNILIGCILGLGICISFSILFRFFLSELVNSNNIWWFKLLWYAFLAGQLSQITSLLSQVDLIDVGTPIFDINSNINDSSEYGYILNALFGYESSPSQQWLLIYTLGLIIPIVIHLILKQLKPFKHIKAVNND